MRALSARSLSYRIVRQFDTLRGQAGEALAGALPQTGERQRCTDLVLGTLRHRQTIDHLLCLLAGRPIARISAPLLSVLRVALYELCYCPHTPEYAIVHEAVEEVKKRAGKKQVAFVNGVLRQIGRQIQDRQAAGSPADPRRMLVTGPGQGCQFARPILPDPEQDSLGYLTTCFSLPAWMVQSWLDAYGYKKTVEIALASNRRPATTLRINPLRTTEEAFVATLVQRGLTPIPCDAGQVQLRGSGDVTEIPGFAEGHFSIQDRTACQVVHFMSPPAAGAVLDFCAAPGGKTTLLAEYRLDHGRVYATDIEPKRLQRVQENAQRLRLRSITTLPWAAVSEHGPYDAILLDVPCSNTGVLAKRVEVRYRMSPRECARLQGIQLELLTQATELLAEGGTLCYSTCSLQPQENGEVIQRFLARHGRFRLERESLILPESGEPDRDGGYAALLIQRLHSPD